MDADTLARHLFMQNEKDQPVILTIPNLSDSFQLFSFCIHMTIQGLMLNESVESLELDSIPLERIEYVGRKLENAGIKMQISIEPPDESLAQPQIQMRAKPHVKSVADIALFLQTAKSTYVLTFELVRNSALIPICHACEKIDSRYK